MVKIPRYQLWCYGVAASSVAIALLLTLLLEPSTSSKIYALFYAAVAISTYYGGMRAGLLATLLSTLAISYFLIPPIHSFAGINLANLIQLGVFVLVTLLINSLNTALRDAKRRAETNLQKLQASEERYRVLAENVPQLVWFARADGFVEYFNQRWYDYTGLTPETSKGWEWQRAIHPDDLSETLRQWKTGLATGNPVEAQFRLALADGSYRWHITRAVPLRNSVGDIVNWFGTCTDIHDQKQAEAALEQQKQELKALVENSPDIIARFDQNLRHVYVSPTVEQATGMPPEAFLGMTGPEMGFPEQVCNLWDPNLRQVFDTKQGKTIEFEFSTPKGKRYYHSMLVPEFAPDGKVSSVLGISRDLTEYKQAEQERLRLLEALKSEQKLLQATIEQMPAGLIVVEAPSGRLLLANAQAQQILAGFSLNLEGVEDYVQPTHPVFHSDGRPYTAEEMPLARSLVKGEIVTGEEMEILFPDGRKTLLVDSRPICNSAREIEAAIATFYDITERKQFEQALRQSEERFRQLVENLHDVFWISDPKQEQLIYVSPAYKKIWGRECESLYANFNEWIEAIHPEDRERIRTVFSERSLVGGYDVEYRVIRPDGTMRWIRDRAVPIQDEFGNAIRAAGIAEDITRLKQDQEIIAALNLDLQRRVSELQTLFEVIPISIAIANDPQCRHIQVNRAFAQILNISPDGNASTTPPENAPPPPFKVYRHGEELPGEELPLQYAIIHGVEVRDAEIDVVRDDGAIFNLYGYASPLYDEQGQPRGAVSAFLDITERKRTEAALKQSEERFRVTQELSLDGFTIMQSVRNEAGEIIDFAWSYVNPKAEEILQRSALELIGRRLLEVLPGNKENSELFDRYVQVVETGEPHDIEIYYEAEGIKGWFRNMTVKLGDGVAISFSDITQRKSAEAERSELLERERTAREEAEKANRIKDEFLAVLSHELRTPLNPIMGWAKLLRSRKFDETTASRALETIERNAKLQAQLIEDLLDVSRILRGKISLKIAPVNLENIIEAAIETVRLSAAAKSIQIQTFFNPNVGLVLGDSSRLQQVVWNLVSNAVKFTPDGGRVEVKLSLVMGNRSSHSQAEPLNEGNENSNITPDMGETGRMPIPQE
ncbi:MAG TPA: hybrid sensor histidine kinase/response regulator, partial [Cyanobacteria bacterium UBA11369]|nr:hybrid sensor histidine kinase/response regulator [Cyanobacteria bacterium UBA11371]HBE33674.1 hybrid sensor histidine kinase/response regulator [Cyanobacteria bacterium UBA11368]HBE52208.1 hybrid sensor histidine kinase/response regulator [Cyanobacteria bacterium UBA11369]